MSKKLHLKFFLKHILFVIQSALEREIALKLVMAGIQLCLCYLLVRKLQQFPDSCKPQFPYLWNADESCECQPSENIECYKYNVCYWVTFKNFSFIFVLPLFNL